MNDKIMLATFSYSKGFILTCIWSINHGDLCGIMSGRTETWTNPCATGSIISRTAADKSVGWVEHKRANLGRRREVWDQVTQFDRFKPPHPTAGFDLKVTSSVETNHMTKGTFSIWFRHKSTSVMGWVMLLFGCCIQIRKWTRLSAGELVSLFFRLQDLVSFVDIY